MQKIAWVHVKVAVQNVFIIKEYLHQLDFKNNFMKAVKISTDDLRLHINFLYNNTYVIYWYKTMYDLPTDLWILILSD